MFKRRVWRDLGREIGAVMAESRASWGVTAGLIILAFLGDPFAALADLPHFRKFVTWCLLIGGGALLFILIRGVLRLSAGDLTRGRETVAASALLGIAFAPPIYVWLASLDMPPNPVYTAVLVVAAALMVSSLRQAIDESVPAPVLQRDRLCNRLPDTGDARVLRLSSSDHHVVVGLSDGRHLRLRMRLRDAVAEMDVTDGFCVHRSHWVALGHIKSVEAAGPRERVILQSGDTVPVGPKYRPNLVAAGFLSD